MSTNVIGPSLGRRDILAGTVITIVMIGIATYFSSGLSLISTFIPGVVFSYVLLLVMWKRKLNLPNLIPFLGWFFIGTSVQFLHFFEEFSTGFVTEFPTLYGGAPYDLDMFVGFNMIAYALFTLSVVAVFMKGVRVLLMPVIFFAVYGAMGNAISHAFWCINQGGYFPGFWTSLIYWVLGPVLIHQLLRNVKQTVVFVCIFIVILVVSNVFGILLSS